MKTYWAQVVMIVLAALIHAALIVDEVKHHVSPWISVFAIISLSIWLIIISIAQIFINRANRGRR